MLACRALQGTQCAVLCVRVNLGDLMASSRLDSLCPTAVTVAWDCHANHEQGHHTCHAVTTPAACVALSCI